MESQFNSKLSEIDLQPWLELKTKYFDKYQSFTHIDRDGKRIIDKSSDIPMESFNLESYKFIKSEQNGKYTYQIIFKYNGIIPFLPKKLYEIIIIDNVNKTITFKNKRITDEIKTIMRKVLLNVLKGTIASEYLYTDEEKAKIRNIVREEDTDFTWDIPRLETSIKNFILGIDLSEINLARVYNYIAFNLIRNIFNIYVPNPIQLQLRTDWLKFLTNDYKTKIMELLSKHKKIGIISLPFIQLKPEQILPASGILNHYLHSAYNPDLLSHKLRELIGEGISKLLEVDKYFTTLDIECDIRTNQSYNETKIQFAIFLRELQEIYYHIMSEKSKNDFKEYIEEYAKLTNNGPTNNNANY